MIDDCWFVYGMVGLYIMNSHPNENIFLVIPDLFTTAALSLGQPQMLVSMLIVKTLGPSQSFC